MKNKVKVFLIWLMVISLAVLAACNPQTEYKLSHSEITLEVGEEMQLSISPAPDKVEWSSANTEIATIKDGKVTAVGVGKTTVIAQIGNRQLTCDVFVTESTSEAQYVLDFTALSLKTGETKQINVFDKDGPIQSAQFSSGNEDVATVSADGLITAVGVGETDITVNVEDSQLTCHVTVAQKYNYELSCETLELAVGGTGKISLITTPTGQEDARPHTFISSDESIVSVNGGSGRVTGVSKGSAVITCLVDGEQLTATVNVTEYTISIGGQTNADIEMRVGDEQSIEIVADPEKEVDAQITLDNESVIKVEENSIVALEQGAAQLSILLGGREFVFNITVVPQVVYTINTTQCTLTLGSGTHQLVVESNPETDFDLTFESSDTSIAQVDDSGLITATGVGEATITTTVDGSDWVFTTTVNVVLDTSLEHQDYTFGSGAVNLTRLDSNKTIDWRFFYDADGIPTRMEGGAGLIGDYVTAVETLKFWDYKAPIIFEDGQGGVSGSYTYGRSIIGSYSLPVTINNSVSSVAIWTGAWKESATIQFKIDGAVVQSHEFSANESALSRKYQLDVDTSSLQDGQTLQLTIEVNCLPVNGGNVSLVAAAVVGKQPHDTMVTASTQATVTTQLTGVQDLTTAGSIDWLSANGVRKQGVPANAVIDADGITYTPNSGTAYDYPGATFTWTDGTAMPSDGLATFKHADSYISIPVFLQGGKTTVTIFATGWNCGYYVGVYDINGVFVNGYQGADEKTNQSVSSKIEITVDVAEEGTYTFRLSKCRGAGNVGWAGIAVSGANYVEPVETVYNMEVGEQLDIILTDSVSAVSYECFGSAVSVDSNGKITALEVGVATITLTYDGVSRNIFVTVSGYEIASEKEVSMIIGGTSAIEVVSVPDGNKVSATYAVEGEDVVSVSEDGIITALNGGLATVIVSVNGKEIGTINVNVANYELNATTHTIVLSSGENSFTLQVIDTTTETIVDAEELVFSSLNEEVASVGPDGVVMAVGVGKAVITVTFNDIEFTCEITVVNVPVTVDAIEYEDGKDYAVNLTLLDETKQTLDWHYFGNNMSETMRDGDFIGQLSTERSLLFYDYRVKMSWSDGENIETSHVGYTAGWTFFEQVSFTVRITKDVEYISVFTGAYHASNTIEVKIGDDVHAVYEFSNCGNNDKVNKNKQIRIYPDVSALTSEQTMTITLTCGAEPDNGWSDNISLVAIAVVGKTDRQTVQDSTATLSVKPLMPAESNVIDITSVGTVDWLYAKNGSGDLARKQGVAENSIIKADEIVCIGGDGYDYFGNKNQYFTWSDGTSAVEGGKVNNFQWINEKYFIPVYLEEGQHQVTLYLSGWKCSYFVSVLDSFGNKIIDANQVVTGDGATSQAVEVTVTLDVTQSGTFTFVMTKQGDGNHGWAGVAVS